MKPFKELHEELSWNTKLYTLLAIVLIISTKVFNAFETNFVLSILLALSVLLFVESFTIIYTRYPRTWRIIKWAVLIILAALLLVGLT